MGMRSHLFTVRVVKHWLPRAVVKSPSLQLFKRDVDVALEDVA